MDEGAILPPLLLAFLLGFKHSFDTDHLVAVSTVLTRTRTPRSALAAGLWWACGHMLTASAITVALFVFRDLLLERYLRVFETALPFLLIGLGALALREVRRVHAHEHRHGGVVHAHLHLHGAEENDHRHRHMLGIGIVHGLASNGELLTLLTLSIGVGSLAGILVGLAVFSLGIVAGMLGFSALVAYPVARVGERVRAGLVLASGALSVGYGIFLLA